MPVHDWTRVDAALFHAFHQHWIITLCNALNEGGLPKNYFALPEQSVRGPVPDVLALKLAAQGQAEAESDGGGMAVITAPPKCRVRKQSEADGYVKKATRVAVRHRHGKVIAVIEIVSPGNKASQAALREFVEKAADLVYDGVHLLVIDLLPPGKRDPQGIAKAIWDEFTGEEFDQVPTKPLTLASFDAGPVREVHIEPYAVGDALPDMPLFLRPGAHVLVKLEASYDAAWEKFPDAMKSLLA